jgi:hypothetical protein
VKLDGVDVHRDAGTERRGDGRLGDIATLRRARLEANNLVERCERCSPDSLSVSNDALPTMKCTLACLSTRNSILPPLISVTAFAVSGVTVPVFGFGMRPRGPSTLPRRPTLPMSSGRRDGRVEVGPASGDLLDELVAADLVGAGGDAASAAGPVAKTMTRAVLPVPWGRLTVPRTIWSALRGSTLSLSATSTVESNFFEPVSRASSTASDGA